ncbi:MAG: carboxypeptidase regulatory-like domain-containing protein [Bryobacteraceae bacterium]
MSFLLAFCVAGAGAASISGRVSDPGGKPVPNASIRLTSADGGLAGETKTGADGSFAIPVANPGSYTIQARVPGFPDIRQALSITGGVVDVDLHLTKISAQQQSITVTADVTDVDILFPDPAQRIFVRQEILDANPGRPGAPISIPGLPIETASSGIKAPQYFAPGVAGDHGEPISQFFQVGTYLVPNNLSSNAHGNGYADPNVMIPPIIESVQVDGGAFNVREGNHSVNLAAIYGFRSRLEPFVTLTGDYRDVDLTAGWSPVDPSVRAWFAIQASFGNGFLDTLEHRQQYKFNGYRVFTVGQHDITLFGIGYFGQSKIPGLIPTNVPNLHDTSLHDTVDPRQRDQTHTGLFAVNDVWHIASGSQLQLSSFFRTYNLSLSSNFGDVLIRQSEFRTVTGGNANFVKKASDLFAFQAGVDYLRDAPRRLDLDHYELDDPHLYGPFQKVTANDVTLNFISPFISMDGKIASWLRYNVGWRRDQIDIDNRDVLFPENSSQKWVGVNSPKATISLIAPQNLPLPSASFSFGETFFTNDPRIGTTAMEGTKVTRANSFQLVLSKTVVGTDFRVTLGRITQEAALAKIDPDTGLQFDEGPARNRFITVAARRYFHGGSIQASVSKADARDISDGTPVPEAPRTIVDVLGTLERLPFHLQARAEFEEVGRKPLGDGFISVPVREFRGALARPFLNGRVQAGVNFLIASGYTGQTAEVLALPGEPAPFERVVRVYLPSYVSVSVSYHFRPRQP